MSGRGIGGPLDEHDAFGSRTASRQHHRHEPKTKRARPCSARRSLAARSSSSTSSCRSSCRRSWSTRRTGSACRSPRTASTPSSPRKAGVDSIEHIWAVGYSSILYAPARRAAGARTGSAARSIRRSPAPITRPKTTTRSSRRWSSASVAWTPTIAKWLRPLSPSAERFRERENQILNNNNANLPPAVRAVTDNAYDKLFKRYTPPAARSGQDRLRQDQRVHRAALSRRAASSRKAPIRRAAWPRC